MEATHLGLMMTLTLPPIAADDLLTMARSLDAESHARVIAARGPFELSDERELLARERIEILVSKNSGTDATYAKIQAARALQLPVIMVARPPRPAAQCVESLDQIVSWLGALHARER